jgi:hypothetical protein
MSAMRKQDMKAGVVYAYRESKYSAYQPVVVLDEKRLYWRLSGDAQKLTDGSQRTFTLCTTKGVTPGRSVGYLAAMPVDDREFGKRDGTPPFDPKRLLTITLDRALSMTFKRGSGKSSDTLRFSQSGARVRVVPINPRFIVGEWDEVMQANDDEAERRRLIEEDLKRESDERVAATKERVDRLAKLGLPGHLPEPAEKQNYRWGGGDDWTPSTYDQSLTGKVSLTLGQLDALLSLVPEGAVYVDPDEQTEDDGWTLAHPPGRAADSPKED